ncbi:hypothetical protein CCM_04221 [Cordyceps militaris CM01]|uniref:Uncharacterized protein n=1 Tax=Cordyceps militaris (strain CM01) TaxID=983644 RepID=G3JE24_CORMM|nr:uncharacterized protein CCM_04221 [Cordyceps militaris CM01]EGX92849.1 hypothetical protein CCM_04221 [Cordyceps militaris CM01]
MKFQGSLEVNSIILKLCDLAAIKGMGLQQFVSTAESLGLVGGDVNTEAFGHNIRSTTKDGGSVLASPRKLCQSLCCPRRDPIYPQDWIGPSLQQPGPALGHRKALPASEWLRWAERLYLSILWLLWNVLRMLPRTATGRQLYVCMMQVLAPLLSLQTRLALQSAFAHREMSLGE